jgi:hypothetical protein
MALMADVCGFYCQYLNPEKPLVLFVNGSSEMSFWTIILITFLPVKLPQVRAQPQILPLRASGKVVITSER